MCQDGNGAVLGRVEHPLDAVQVQHNAQIRRGAAPPSASAAAAVDSILARVVTSRRSCSASKAAASEDTEDEDKLLAATPWTPWRSVRRARRHVEELKRSGSGGMAGERSGIAWLRATDWNGGRRMGTRKMPLFSDARSRGLVLGSGLEEV